MTANIIIPLLYATF